MGQFELHSLDPSTSGGFFTRLQVAETLVDADLRGVLQPGLATGWETSPTGSPGGSRCAPTPCSMTERP
ncbi:hypothetical protein PJ267_17410 [Arthrobacter sp. OVS8]|nr:hypothetical protein PJ267_17410 [Arthrobacter sp. OVS8]